MEALLRIVGGSAVLAGFLHLATSLAHHGIRRGGSIVKHRASSRHIESSKSWPITGLDASYVVVDTVAGLAGFLDIIETALHGATAEAPMVLNVDFEGINLCKTGKVCLGQFQVSGQTTVYIVDFIAISNPFQAAAGRLKRILESEQYIKVFFDPRNDCDALIHQFDVHVQKVLDLQVAEVAFRRHVKALRVQFVAGLGRVFDTHLDLVGSATATAAATIKAQGRALFAPELGGSYDVFADRPLATAVAEYAAVDILFFDLLRQQLFVPLSPAIQASVLAVSELRLTECLQPGYVGHGQHKALAPDV